MPSTVANHLHRYKKADLGRNGNSFLVYKCTKPACTHYVRIDLTEGKLCECNRCGEPMLITKVTLTHSSGRPMARPHCIACTKSKKIEQVDAMAEFLNQKNLGDAK